jgi:hypothetical protein
MLIPDDDPQFEAQLRRFVPRQVAPLPAARAIRRRQHVPLGVAAVILAAVGIVLWQLRTKPQPLAAPVQAHRGELTLGQAQAVLVQAPSFDAALDALDRATRPAAKPREQGKRSALEALENGGKL